MAPITDLLGWIECVKTSRHLHSDPCRLLGLQTDLAQAWGEQTNIFRMYVPGLSMSYTMLISEFLCICRQDRIGQIDTERERDRSTDRHIYIYYYYYHYYYHYYYYHYYYYCLYICLFIYTFAYVCICTCLRIFRCMSASGGTHGLGRGLQAEKPAFSG